MINIIINSQLHTGSVLDRFYLPKVITFNTLSVLNVNT